MSNIQFDDSQYQANQNLYTPQTEKGMIGWLVKKGIAKDARTANIILLIVAIVFFGIAFFLIKKDNAPRLTPEQIEESKAYFDDLIKNAQQNQ